MRKFQILLGLTMAVACAACKKETQAQNPADNVIQVAETVPPESATQTPATMQNTAETNQNPAANAGAPAKRINLAEQVRKAIAQDHVLGGNSANIKVSADGGTITLAGLVPSRDAKNEAVERARQVAGVSSVVDKLEIVTSQNHE